MTTPGRAPMTGDGAALAGMASLATALLLWIPCGAATAQHADWEDAEDRGGWAGEEGTVAAPARAVERPGETGAEGEQEQEQEEPEGPPLQGTFLLWAEVATFVGTFDAELGVAAVQIDGFHLSPMIGVGWYGTDDILIGATLGLATYLHGDYTVGTTGEVQPGGVALRFGNALVDAHLTTGRGALRHRVGVGVTLPLATANDGAEAAALQLALAERGGWDPWMWAPERLSIVATGDLETDLSETVVAGAEAGIGVLFNAGDRDQETVFAAQAAGHLEVRTGDLALGGRLVAVFADEVLPRRKSWQLGLEPYARLALGDAAALRLGFHLNLISPFGFSFAEGRAWGLSLGFTTEL